MVPPARPTTLIVAVALALVVSACVGQGGDDETSASDSAQGVTANTDEPDPADGPQETDAGVADAGVADAAVPPGALASAEFVTTAIDGADARSLLANTIEADPGDIVPYERSLVAARLADLSAFAGTVTQVLPSTDAYPDAAEGLGPSCDRSAGLFCQVDLAAGDGSIVASVVVSWFGDGVTDFAIITRSGTGTANGIGQARCGAGYRLLHGGHTPDRFDVAVCIDDSGALQYSGYERATDLDIRLDACQSGSNQWQATNEGFVYSISDGDASARSELEVFDPQGDLIASGVFTPVHVGGAATPLFC